MQFFAIGFSLPFVLLAVYWYVTAMVRVIGRVVDWDSQ